MTSGYQSTSSPLLGTDVTVRVSHRDGAVAATIGERIVDEIARLEAMLSRYRPDSALERWKRDELDDVPEEFAAVMGCALGWFERTAGLLNPRAGAVAALWRTSAERDAIPSDADLARVADLVATPGFELDATGRPLRRGDCDDLELHAFAKGWIVDRAVGAALGPVGDAGVLVSAGGDVLRSGGGWSEITVEDPRRPYDNAAPIDRVRLERGGLATSGHARRGIVVAGRRFSHIVDPRRGRPADGAASVSVLAGSAEAADGWATALVLSPPDGIVAAADAAGVGVLAVFDDAVPVMNDRWRAQQVRAARPR